VGHLDDLLRTCCRLILTLGRARSVTIFAPAPPGSGQEPVWIHQGPAGPVPELADVAAAARYTGEIDFDGPTPNVAVSESRNARIFRLAPRQEGTAEGGIEGQPGRRSADRGHPSNRELEGTVWVGVGFGEDGDPLERSDPASAGPWRSLLDHAAILADHARAITPVLVDPVTGLGGRADFQATVDHALVRAAHTARPLALLFVNPDEFGGVNERFGRDAGDRALRELALRLRATLRQSDRVCKYGGAIFGCLLEGTPVAGAGAAAEKILRAMSEGAFLDGAVRLGFSIGVADYDPEEHGELSTAELVRRADQALNAAKRAGGSQVRIWKAGEETESLGNLDRLSGIFTGNMAKDYRNMVLLWDSVNTVAAAADVDALAERLVERLYSTIRPDRVGIFAQGDEGWTAGSWVRGDEEKDPTLADAEAALATRAWDEGRACLAELEARGGEPRVGVAAPLRPGEEPACLWLEGRPGRLTLDTSDLVFLEGLASQMTLALERARLVDQERARQEHEQNRLRTELDDLRRAIDSTHLSYRSRSMEAILATARRVAPTDATVLITGESGVGKELMARTLHELSSRADEPLVIVDCGAISSTLIDSELFGHEKGAFTGAADRKTGRLAEADGATVFLDEIGDMPLEVQSKLLRFVQEKQLTPVGSTRSRTVDARIIAATNIDLASLVAAGRFREDLYYRLNVVRLEVPPLRERPDDVLPLAQQFVKKYATLYNKPVRGIETGAAELLAGHPWPGNVRQLQNRIMQAVLLTDRELLSAADFNGLAESSDGPVPPVPAATRPKAPVTGGYSEGVVARLREALARQIDETTAVGAIGPVPLGKWLSEDLVLEANGAASGVVRRGAALLGIPETTFRRRLRDAARRQATGLSPRPDGWGDVQSLLGEVLRADRLRGQNRLKLVERVLLDEIVARFPEDTRTASALLGVSEPTLLRRLA
jgi:diguanylate cyclase (GGDEF)-like protein